MPIKRQHPSLAAQFARTLERAGQNKPMAPMDTVKKSGGQNHRPWDLSKLRGL